MDFREGRGPWLSHHLEIWEREMPPFGAAEHPLERTGAGA